MRFVHRLVVVIAFFGALFMLLFLNNTPAVPTSEATLFVIAPGILAAIIIYPVAWLFAGLRD